MEKHPTKQPLATEKESLSFTGGKPGTLLLVITTTIFLAELFIMMILDNMQQLNSFQEALFDSILLTTIVFPTLFFLVFRPMINHIAIRQRAEQEKNALITELNEALAEVKMLQGVIPICSSCKSIRDDEGYWHQVEAYVSAHSTAEFTHGICDKCLKDLYPDKYEAIKKGLKE